MQFKHLKEIHESYLQHMRFAITCGLKLIGAGLAVIVHALLPCIFQTKASDVMRALLLDIERRKQLSRTFTSDNKD